MPSQLSLFDESAHQHDPAAVSGHASALLATGFFGGFVIGAPVFGVHVDVNKIYTSHC